ncbi:MAG: 50S ribosomal protein L25/general stress protein Ctc [Archangium sp.]|nr:50S ribosomal protein L25/general stress protein Ctc [Archangium sp.]
MSLVATHLEAKTRTAAGKGAARRSREGGQIPAIVYGKSLEKPLSISVDAKALRAAVATPKKMNTVLGLKVDGGAERVVLLKDYQMDPVNRDLLHADFIEVKENEKVKVKVPVVLVGKAEGVAVGGILSQMKREIEVHAQPAAIPEKIEVDVTSLKIASSLHINDLKLPAGVVVKTHVNYTIAVVTAPEVEKVVEAAPAAAGAAPAAGDAKAGDAKAGDAKAGDAKAADGKAAPAAAAAKPAGKK